MYVSVSAMRDAGALQALCSSTPSTDFFLEHEKSNAIKDSQKEA